MQAGCGNNFALGAVEFEADARALCPEFHNSCGNRASRPSQAAIVQVRENELEAAGRACGIEALQDGLQGQREQQRSQGVTLLHAGLGRDSAFPAEKVARLSITPGGPSR